MNCEQIEELLPSYIEHDINPEHEESVTVHLNECPQCRKLKEKLESILTTLPDLEVEVPFLVRNRLYYIPESLQKRKSETKLFALRWVAASIGIIALCLNLFYFTNIYPPANQALHLLVSQIEKLAVKTEGFFSRLQGSKKLFVTTTEKKITQVENKDKDKITSNPPKGGENG